MSFHFEYFLRPIDEVFPIATDFPGVIPRIVFVLRHTVAFDAIPLLAASPQQSFRHGLNLNGSWRRGTSSHVRCTGKLSNRLKRQIIIHATLVSVGLVQQDAQFVLFPFALTIAQRISLAGRLLYDRSL